MTEIRRMWVNQPSKLQAYHHLNGKNVLAEGSDDVVRVWFVSGPLISQTIHKFALSEGWLNEED